ncbi:MAG: CRISPR system precrRNA processing endoribonuclease RAMP protein Cas6 [Anaerolineae bacterium]|nr:CRISPR system precrRNA processing endoribonuclease RAMP protein Cas6 [Anaerolineae bacterium]
MWNFIKSINLIRYLMVWRVNASFVQLPRYFAIELSRTLGTLVAERLPAPMPREWRRVLDAWAGVEQEAEEPDKPTPTEAEWPLRSVLWVYPLKRGFGLGEPILWELKLIGDSADHGIFLEHILPVMEQAATTTDTRWLYHNCVWGHFDIQSVYVARGARWEPLVTEGKLDLDYRAAPTQWAEGLAFQADAERTLHQLTWLTPVDLTPIAGTKFATDVSSYPTMHRLLDALMERLTVFLPGKHNTVDQVWSMLAAEEQTELWRALERAQLTERSLERVPRYLPGRWIGTQTFTEIPASLVPYLQLAAIVHVGKQTHLGCGTFRLE